MRASTDAEHTLHEMPSISTLASHGWPRNLHLGNPFAELTITLDVGPRILDYRLRNAENIFHTVADQLGGCGESMWRSRGGHRFWLAPESLELSYYPDNQAVDYREDPVTGEIIIDALQATPQPVLKTLGIRLSPESSQVTVRHTATNQSDRSISVAPWGLSVMRPGGLEIIPQPPSGKHPEALLPDRKVVLWPYTDLRDKRWQLGTKFWTLRQTQSSPTKIGLAHREGWVAYLHKRMLFVKVIEYQADALYPDGGCNFETFTNDKMLEIESLGPLTTLEPGASVSHSEHWDLIALNDDPDCAGDEQIKSWLLPLLQRRGIPGVHRTE